MKTQKTTSKKSPASSKGIGGNDTLYEPDPEKHAIAAGIVVSSVIKRRNEQSVNWYMFALGVFGLVFLPYWWISSIIKKSEIATIRRNERQEAYSGIIGEDGMTHVAISGPGGGMIPQPTLSGVSYFTSTPAPIPQTGPTYTPTPTTTATPTAYVMPQSTTPPEILLFNYSYYYPDLGGANCHIDNWDGSKCADTSASGRNWRDWLGSGVAIHPSMIDKYPFGTLFRVLAPAELQGDFIVMDLCPGCIRAESPGYVWIDFLDTEQRVDWSSPVVIQVIR